MIINGRKGGSGNARTTVDSPDSIQSTSYAKILLALGEGAFNGGLDGTRVFMDGTPITDANGNANFSGVTWAFRSGTPDQSSIPSLPGVEHEIAVSTVLTARQTGCITTSRSAIALALALATASRLKTSLFRSGRCTKLGSIAASWFLTARW